MEKKTGRSRKAVQPLKPKKLVYWAVAIPAFLALLLFAIVFLDHSDNDISRAMASKAMALSFADRDDIVASQGEHGSHFGTPDQDEWYAKYIDYMIEEGYLEPGDEKISKSYAMDALTYGEAAYAADRVSKGLSSALNVSKNKYKKAMPKEEWWLFYESFLKKADSENAVKKQKLVLYGTPKNVKEAAAWTAYTDQGTMNFEGVSLDACIDRKIEVYERDGSIITLCGVQSEKVTYKNVWIVPGESGGMDVYIGTIVRTFPEEEKLKDRTDGVLADVELDKGKIRKLSLKEDMIEGKVLSVKDDTIEIDGYGTLKLDDDFKVYKTYGVVKEQKKRDVLVGYDLGKFVVAGKKVCAALLNHDFSATNIRVLIMNEDYSSLFHTKVVLQSDSTMHVTWGESEETLSPGTKLSVSPGDDRLKEGRMTITLEDPQKEIRILSTKRAQGTPSYFGSFELSEESDGLLLINELDVEDYLTRVVPSEMPSNYELEALKAQAVCARTYAYRQIKANAYSRYGAHVDDSTNYQVYNNTESSERTNLAVKETDGKIVYYNDTPAETYYFSTSCGYSTDGTIWGASKDEVPYLKGIGLTEKKKIPDLTDNDTFLKFIQGQGEQNYDSSFPMYRWKTTITNKKLQQKVDTIGEIQGIFVTSRGTGGIAQTVQIVGSEGTKTLKGQSQIRSVLGSESLVYKKNDGTELTGWSTLPSAFFSVDETARDEEKDIRTFTIWGGGYGHGVGMSQNGAQEMAREGKNYEEILMFFYDGVEIRDCEED